MRCSQVGSALGSVSYELQEHRSQGIDATCTLAGFSYEKVLFTMGILTAILVLFPFIPYLKRLPYYLGIHRLIWREYYHDARAAQPTEALSASPDSSPAT